MSKAKSSINHSVENAYSGLLDTHSDQSVDELVQRTSRESVDKSAYGSPTITYAGGVCLLINNLYGPGAFIFPVLFQQAGFVVVLVLIVGISLLIYSCCVAICHVLQKIPGNNNFQRRMEFSSILSYYLPKPLYVIAEICVIGAFGAQVIGAIIQTGQAFDEMFSQIFGKSCALIPNATTSFYKCVHDAQPDDAASVFSNEPFALSAGLMFLALLSAPLSFWNLDDNIFTQWLSVILITICTLIIIPYMMLNNGIHQSIPVVGTTFKGCLGAIIFNFPLPMTIPSWINEKKRDVSAKRTLVTAFCITVFFFFIFSGVGAAMAYKPHYFDPPRDTFNLLTLIAHLNQAGAWVVYYTIVLISNITSIPVFIIFIRYNMIQDGCPTWATRFVQVGVWVVACLFFTGDGFDQVMSYGGSTVTSIVNIFIPIFLLVCERRKHAPVYAQIRALAPSQLTDTLSLQPTKAHIETIAPGCENCYTPPNPYAQISTEPQVANIEGPIKPQLDEPINNDAVYNFLMAAAVGAFALCVAATVDSVIEL